MGRPKVELVLSEAEHAQLSSMARSRTIGAALSARARIVLAAAAGEANSEIGQRLQIFGATVGKWRRRFVERRPGKPRSIDDERMAELIHKTWQCPYSENPAQPAARSARAAPA